MIKLIAALFLCTAAFAAKPSVWIISDGADKTLRSAPGKYITDPDDISAIAAYLLMANEFDTRAIVVGGNLNSQPHQRELSMKKWADDLFLTAYLADLPNLNKMVGGYPENIRFVESYAWKNPEKYDPAKTYRSLENYPSVQALFQELEKTDGTLYILCWGTQSEPALLINHCLASGREDLLKKAVFISHWTNSYFHVGTMEKPWRTHNAWADEEATAYVKKQAEAGAVVFYECAAIGQAGIVEGSPRGAEFYEAFTASHLGRVYRRGKFPKGLKTVDDSDSATFWVLLGTHGVTLDDIASDGTNTPETEQRNEKAFFKASAAMRNELLHRSNAAAGIK
ncbi:nucleoside hydrolase-like domain-containing protein [Pontiella agarivorans]|uniref:DUF1593 domain-containing protein n=1 Tax=Pontiella agarivorans TaxID=3038953 RepID=A0ABU5MW12_9BACT|nr:nucleoside hydrolase-like domain-containing protein [Pontiella agarivorans]MDZ8118400.1 DUF1593 domain-containing protein [Pontiella agarivorans]